MNINFETDTIFNTNIDINMDTYINTNIDTDINWGCHSVIGGRPYQEDRYITNVNINNMYLFGVFDGHGGDEVSAFLAENMSSFILNSINENSDNLETALKDAFNSLHKNIQLQEEKNSIGSTAIVTLIYKDKIVCANCGDSRAILYKNNEVISLSEDHKPERLDEKERILKAGGCIFYNCGASRVMGILNLSRSIGDSSMNKYGIISEPDVLNLERSSEDEFIVIASDGLWETMSNEEVAKTTQKCLKRAINKGANKKKSAEITSKVLTRLVKDKFGTDNTTVIVIYF